MLSKVLLSAAAFSASTFALANQAAEFVVENATAHNEPLHPSSASEMAAFGNAVIHNQCPYDIYLWSVDQVQDPQTPTVIKARSPYSEQFRQPCPGCGVSMKISLTDRLEGGVGGKITQFEYAIDNEQIYYDISFVDCANGESADTCPGHEKGLRIDSPEGSCQVLNCPAGSYCVNDAYYVDDPDTKLGIPAPVKGCARGVLGMDVVFHMCAGEPGL